MSERHDDLQKIIDGALEDMAAEAGDGFDPQGRDLAEFCRRTGLTRSKARTIKSHGFKALPHGNAGKKAAATVLTGHTGLVDDQLRKGVTNSQVIFDRLRAQGYEGGLTTARAYVAGHRDLVPPKRRQPSPQGNRGRRLGTGPGEACQTGWGFVAVLGLDGAERKIACFAMVCHHCGLFHVEFFPNARQENLLIGMARAFAAMGVPDWVPADNMRSVVVGRGVDGRPVWQGDYAALVGCLGFRTRPSEPRHPLARGRVERLIRFARDNFLAGRDLADITAPDEEALLWCADQAGRRGRAVACVPRDEHECACLAAARALEVTREVEAWLCPRRRTAFDGFVSYEGRRFGVPYWYDRRECRVSREGRVPRVYSDDLSREIVAHAVTWDRRDSWCDGQWSDGQPCELPSQPVETTVVQVAPGLANPAFAKFDFGRWA